jgi:hypothetical protein
VILQEEENKPSQRWKLTPRDGDSYLIEKPPLKECSIRRQAHRARPRQHALSSGVRLTPFFHDELLTWL